MARMRLLSIFFIALFVIAVVPGANAAKRRPTAKVTVAATQVYLMRGFIDIFSTGLDEIAAKLRPLGYITHVSNHTHAMEFADMAIKECLQGAGGPIVLIGHSLGGGAIMDIANRLREAGVTVSLMVPLDSVNAGNAPGNVRRLVNYYQSNSWGVVYGREPEFKGVLENVDLKDHTEFGHASLPNSPYVHSRILELMPEAARHPCREPIKVEKPMVRQPRKHLVRRAPAASNPGTPPATGTIASNPVAPAAPAPATVP